MALGSPCRSPRRSTPHSVAPTISHFRDSMLVGSGPLSSENLRSLPCDNQDVRSRSNSYGTIGDDRQGNGLPHEYSSLIENRDEEQRPRISFGPQDNDASGSNNTLHRQPFLNKQWKVVEHAASQIPAIALVTLFHLMVGIPFGVSYFPVGWKSSSSSALASGGDAAETDGGFLMDGPFPLAGKETLGIRMFLFSTIIGQLVMTYASNFNDCIALQMVENVPFCQSLTYIVVQIQGYGKEALSTLFFLFGLASVIVGVVFYLLGRMEMGRVLYFFPAHVLVGCIGGIGVFIAKTGLEVTINTGFSLGAAEQKIHLLMVVFVFEIGLRLLTHWTKESSGKPRYPLLSPIYFCLITPLFYLGIWASGSSIETAVDAGYFFPLLNDSGGDSSFISSVWNESVLDIFHIVNLSSISWEAVLKSVPTLVALVLFSLIHVPINIPAFAVSTDVDVDMNVELMAHGYSNGIVGLLGGLQNYMAYTQSIIYFKSGGKGKSSSLAVALSTSLLFFVGPAIASYMPRCMAGTLLLHCGIDLFLEGVYDSFGKYDYLEYTGIWSITIIMTFFGMEAALIAGVIAALSTYAIQSVTYPKPIRGSMTAATLRSSAWTRSPDAFAILDSRESGRNKIFVIQLQGHLFFGNISLFSDGVKTLIEEKPFDEKPYIIIMDFSLVLGIDSSAAQAMIKLKDSLIKQFGIKVSIFVSGNSSGFPCEFDLYEGLNSNFGEMLKLTKVCPLDGKVISVNIGLGGSCVCDNLDQALIHAEDALIAMVKPNLLRSSMDLWALAHEHEEMYCDNDERQYALRLLSRQVPGEDGELVGKFLSYFDREVYSKGNTLWKQGTVSDSAKLLVCGQLMSVLENETGTTEAISIGSMIGESGLVQNLNRNSTVLVLKDNTILYSLCRESWENMNENDPKCARILYAIVVRYLTHRVQHVSNRIFETRCLPI